MHALTDCALYLVNTAPTEPDAVWVTEVWRSRAAHHASLTTEAAQEALRRGRTLIERVGEQIAVEPVEGRDCLLTWWDRDERGRGVGRQGRQRARRPG